MGVSSGLHIVLLSWHPHNVWLTHNLPHLSTGHWSICLPWSLLKLVFCLISWHGQCRMMALKKLSHLLLLTRLPTLIFTDAANPLNFSNILHLDLDLELPTHSYHYYVPLNRDLYWDLLRCDFLASINIFMLISKLPFQLLRVPQELLYLFYHMHQLLFCLKHHETIFMLLWSPPVSTGFFS